MVVLPLVTGHASGMPLEISGQAPRVEEMAIGGFSFAAAVGSGEQLRSLAVTSPNSISIRFSEEVLVTSGALTLTNLDGVTLSTLTSFNYNLATQTATWTFSTSLANGRTCCGSRTRCSNWITKPRRRVL